MTYILLFDVYSIYLQCRTFLRFLFFKKMHEVSNVWLVVQNFIVNVQLTQESPTASNHNWTLGSAPAEGTKDGSNGLRRLLGHAGNFKAAGSHCSTASAVGIRAAVRKKKKKKGQRFVSSWTQTKDAEKTGLEAFTNDCSIEYVPSSIDIMMCNSVTCLSHPSEEAAFIYLFPFIMNKMGIFNSSFRKMLEVGFDLTQVQNGVHEQILRIVFYFYDYYYYFFLA